MQGTQRRNNAHASLTRGNNLVNVTQLSSLVRVQQLFLVLGDQLSAASLNIAAFSRQRGQLTTVQNIHRTLSTHHANLSGGPRQVNIGTQFLRAHHNVRTAVRLTGNDGNQRNSRLRVSVE